MIPKWLTRLGYVICILGILLSVYYLQSVLIYEGLGYTK